MPLQTYVAMVMGPGRWNVKQHFRRYRLPYLTFIQNEFVKDDGDGHFLTPKVLALIFKADEHWRAREKNRGVGKCSNVCQEGHFGHIMAIYFE